MRNAGIAALALAAATVTPGVASAQDGNAAAGQEVFNARCTRCHTSDEGGANRTGPNLFGVVGAMAGSRDNGFRYSSALSGSGVTWNPGNLKKWVEDPQGFISGNRMSFAGLSSPRDRNDVVAFLRTLQ